ncbi:MAG: hypothetical protein ACYC0X_34665 [Pirellulaceae bacterium]
MFSRANLVCGAIAVLLASFPMLGRSQDRPTGLIRKEYDARQLLADSADADRLVDVIRSVIHSEEWDNVGGAGTIAARKNVLDVWQTPAIHAEVARLLDALTKMPGVKQNESTAKKEIGKTIVVTEGKAPPEALTVIVYDVTNLVRTGDYDRLVSSILRIEDTTWQDVGGPGVCEVYPSAKALVIVQTTAVHRQICDWLRHERQ